LGIERKKCNKYGIRLFFFKNSNNSEKNSEKFSKKNKFSKINLLFFKKNYFSKNFPLKKKIFFL